MSTLASKEAARLWWVGRCPRCLAVKAAVEVGDGDSYSKGELERLGYVVNQQPGPVSFRPHDKECGA